MEISWKKLMNMSYAIFRSSCLSNNPLKKSRKGAREYVPETPHTLLMMIGR